MSEMKMGREENQEINVSKGRKVFIVFLHKSKCSNTKCLIKQSLTENSIFKYVFYGFYWMYFFFCFQPIFGSLVCV